MFALSIDTELSKICLHLSPIIAVVHTNFTLAIWLAKLF